MFSGCDLHSAMLSTSLGRFDPEIGCIVFETTTLINSMKVLQILALLIAGIALCNAVATGGTGATGATGGEASKAEEMKAEKAKKEEMEHTVANKKSEQLGNIKKVLETAIADTNKFAGEQKVLAPRKTQKARNGQRKLIQKPQKKHVWRDV